MADEKHKQTQPDTVGTHPVQRQVRFFHSLINNLRCILFHRRYHNRRHICDGLSFSFMAGECVKCGKRWGGGRLAINPKTQESKILMPDETMPDGWRWF